MAYQWTGENWGRTMIYDACKAGLRLEVGCDGEVDYAGTSPAKAWEAVTACDESTVRVIHPDGRREAALFVLDYGQDGSEVIADYTTGGWIDQWWEAKWKATA